MGYLSNFYFWRSNLRYSEEKVRENVLINEILEITYKEGSINNINEYIPKIFFNNKVKSSIDHDTDIGHIGKKLRYLVDIGFIEYDSITKKTSITQSGMDAYKSGIFRSASVSAFYGYLSFFMMITTAILSIIAIIVSIIAIWRS